MDLATQSFSIMLHDPCALISPKISFLFLFYSFLSFFSCLSDTKSTMGKNVGSVLCKKKDHGEDRDIEENSTAVRCIYSHCTEYVLSSIIHDQKMLATEG